MKRISCIAVACVLSGLLAMPVALADEEESPSPWPARWPWYHNGLDVPASPGRPVVSPVDGIVFAVGAIDVPTAGLPSASVVHLIGQGRHAGLAMRLFYLTLDGLAPGDEVVGGQSVLGTVADLRVRWPFVPAAQLHVEVFRNGERIDPTTVFGAPAGSRP